MCKDWFCLVTITSLLKITRFTIISKVSILNSSSIMWARRLQEAFTRSMYSRFEIRRTLRIAKDERHLLKFFQRLFIIFCSWDHIIAGFMKKFFRFKTGKWRRQFVFFRRCHQWVSGATVVVMSETASMNIIFAFSQHWGFHYFIYSYCKSSQLFFVGFIVVVKEIYTSVACDIGDMFWTYNLVCFLQLPDCCFSRTMIRKRFSHFL